MKKMARPIKKLRDSLLFLMFFAPFLWLVIGCGAASNLAPTSKGNNNRYGTDAGAHPPTTGPDQKSNVAQPDTGVKQSWGSNIGTGGAQDIGQFRKILQSGKIPHPETLDANGFFSEHYTQLPPPTCQQTFCLHGMLARHKSFVSKDTLTILQLGMNSAQDISKLPRLPLNLVVVIDVSGSMAAESKLEYVKTGLKLMLDKLNPEDTLAIVQYNSKATLLRPSAPIKDKSTVIQLINQLSPSGGTNIHDGLQIGFKEALKHFSDKFQNRVIFLSDGQATVGITENKEILSMSNIYTKQGIGLTTIGVGLSFNVTLMRSLSESGSGNYYFLESQAAIQEVFQQEMDYFVVPIAFDIKISVTLGLKYKFLEIFGTNLWQITPAGGHIYIPSIFLTGRKSHDDPKNGLGGRRGGGSAIMLNLAETLPVGVDPRQVAGITLTYRPAGEKNEITQNVSVDFRPSSTQLSSPYYSHKAIEKNYVMLNIFLGLRHASRLAALEQNPNGALSILTLLKDNVSNWNNNNNDEDIKADLKIIELFRQNLIKLLPQKTAP